MSPLQRLLWTDLRNAWRQALAICAVLASGIAINVMSTSTIQSLDETRERYYRDYRFGDLFVHLTRAPLSLAAKLERIPGVARVEPRIERDALANIPDMVEPVTCRILSLPNHDRGGLNGLYLLQGRLPRPGSECEVVANELFARAHRWTPGAEVEVILGGREQRLRIVGIGMSPEFIYAVQPGQLLADNRRFGVFWMRHRDAAAAFNMEGAFNDAVIAVVPRASLSDVMFHIDQLTEPYGGRATVTRADHSSHRRIADEMHQLRGMAYVSPSIFLAVSAFLFNIMLSRMIRRQQEQIAMLRAFGFRRWEIGRHYLRLLAVLVVAGSVVGCAAGLGLSHWMTSVYVRFFRFPNVQHEFAVQRAALAVLVGWLAAVAGGASAIRHAMGLPPAVAMRPEAPNVPPNSWLERIGQTTLLSPRGRMVYRRLLRARRSTILSVLGMACALAVLVLGSFMSDTIDYVIDVQFQRSQRQDVTLTFNEVLSIDALDDLRHLPGVSRVEGLRAVPVRLSHGTRRKQMSLLGLDPNPALFRVLDDQLRPVPLETSGLTVSQKLAETLELAPGNSVHVELLDGSRQRCEIRVSHVFRDYTDPTALMSRAALHEALREGPRVTGAFLAVDSLRERTLFATLKQTPTLAAIHLRSAAVRNFEEMIAANLRPMRLINSLFASIIAFGVILNCALVTLAERGRDLATLRVIGFSRREVSVVLLGELAVITLLSLPLGLPLGYGFSYLATLALDTESHRFPLVVDWATFTYAVAVILIAAIISSLIVRRTLDSLDLVAVLKAKE